MQSSAPQGLSPVGLPAGVMPVIPVTRPCPRGTFTLPEPEGGMRLVTYRVTSQQGRLHVVFFRDRQPPLVLKNAAGRPLEVLLDFITLTAVMQFVLFLHNVR